MNVDKLCALEVSIVITCIHRCRNSSNVLLIKSTQRVVHHALLRQQKDFLCFVHRNLKELSHWAQHFNAESFFELCGNALQFFVFMKCKQYIIHVKPHHHHTPLIVSLVVDAWV